jgi:ppGpp synthetase/RelA/SpoT-type nucleotidyltranferase
MTVIEKFLSEYNKQYDFYSELSKIGNNKLEGELAKRGIRAIVSNRAKKPDRLKGKLIQRNEEKKYKTVKQIFDDVIDLAGVRVALYFPSDRDLIDEIVSDLFEIIKKKQFPISSHKPKYEKRFSGYWATHYRVKIKKTDKEFKRYQNTVFEIQVASVLMHAWAEVEHDLVYKPYSGKLTEEELSILDEINGLVLTGEIALERLQKAITKRTKESNEIADKYELTNYIVNSLSPNYIEKLKLGNTRILNNYFKNIYKYDPQEFTMFLNNVNQSVDESISDQLINMFISDYLKENIKDKSLKQFFNNVQPNRDTSGFESFVKCWIILEKSYMILLAENNLKDRHRKYFVPDFSRLTSITNITNQEIRDLKIYRRIRNELLHGIESPKDDYLNEAFQSLRGITSKLINQIRDDNQREELIGELNEI